MKERPAPAQVLLRGLSLLEALNRRAVGSVEELAQDTRLPNSTVVLMPNTLALAGYVRRLPKRGGYSLAERVLGLSWGFRSEDAVVETARPLLAAFTAEHKWPVSIATLAVDAMRIRATTLQDVRLRSIGSGSTDGYRCSARHSGAPISPTVSRPSGSRSSRCRVTRSARPPPLTHNRHWEAGTGLASRARDVIHIEHSRRRRADYYSIGACCTGDQRLIPHAQRKNYGKVNERG